MPGKIDQKIDFYFKYIQHLKEICQEHNIPFHKSDRILYELDKMENKEIPINY
jgi:hypothetical protein